MSDTVGSLEEETPSNRKGVWVLFSCALILRIAILPMFLNQPLNIYDEQAYQQLAQGLLTRGEFGFKPGKLTAIRPPAYPMFLASVYKLAGRVNTNIVRILQIVISVLSGMVLLILLGRITFPKVSLLATVVFLFYPTLLCFDYLILSETLFIFLFLLMLLALMAGVEKRSTLYFACAGVLLGLASLTRSITYPLALPLAVLLVFLQSAPRLKAASRSLVFVLGFCLAIAPWAVRNYHVFGSYVPVGTMGGLNLSMGNYQFTPLNRAWAAVGVNGDKSWGHVYYNQIRGLNEAQKQKVAIELAKTYMLDHPAQTLLRSVIKAANLWGLERVIIAGMQEKIFPSLKNVAVEALLTVAILLAYVMVAMLGSFGLVWRITSNPHSFDWLALYFILGFTGLCALVFGHSRYHLPLIPLLCFYAAWTLCHFRQLWAAHKHSVFKLASACFVFWGILWSYGVFIGSIDKIKAFLTMI